MRRFFLVALIFIPIVGATLIVRQWNSDGDRPRVRMEESHSDTPITSSLSLSESSGRRSFFVSRQNVTIDGAIKEVPSRYWFMEEWHKNPDGSLLATGITIVLLATPKTSAELSALPIIEVTDGAERQLAALRRAQESHDTVTAQEALLSGGEGVSDTQTVMLRQNVKIQVGDVGQRTTLESDDALIAIESDGLQSLRIEGAFTLRRPNMDLAARGLSVTPEILTASQSIKMTWHGPPSLTLNAGGPLTFRPSADSRSRSGWDRLRLDEGKLHIAGEVSLTQETFKVKGQEANYSLAPQASTHNIVLQGNVSLQVDEWIATTDRVHLQESKEAAMVAHLTGAPTAIRHQSARGQLFATAMGPVQIREVKAKSLNPASLVVTLKDEVAMQLKEGSSSDGSLRCGAATITLIDRPSNIANDEGHTRFAFHKCAASGNVEGKLQDLTVHSEDLVLAATINGSGRLIGHEFRAIGASLLSWKETNESDPTQTLRSTESLMVHSAASPFAASFFSAKGNVQWTGQTGDGQNRTLGAREISGSLVAAPPRLPGDKRSRRIDSLVARTDVEARFDGTVTIQCEQLRLDNNATRTTAIGSPAVLVYGPDKKQQTIRAPQIVWDSQEKLLIAEGGIQGDLLFPELLLLSVERKERGAITSGPFETTPLRTEIPWKLVAGKLVARMSQHKSALNLEQLDVTGDLKLTNANQSIEAEVLMADMVQGTGWARGQPVRIRVTKEHGTKPVVDTVVAPWILMTDNSILLKGACHATLHIRQPGGTTTPVPLEKLVVTCEQDILIGQNEAFFSGRTHMIRGNPAETGLDMKCNRATVRLDSNNQSKGTINRIEGFGDVEIISGSLKGYGDAVVFDDAERLVHLSALKGTCKMTLGSGITETSSAICFNMRTRSLKSYDVRGGLRK